MGFYRSQWFYLSALLKRYLEFNCLYSTVWNANCSDSPCVLGLKPGLARQSFAKEFILSTVAWPAEEKNILNLFICNSFVIFTESPLVPRFLWKTICSAIYSRSAIFTSLLTSSLSYLYAAQSSGCFSFAPLIPCLHKATNFICHKWVTTVPDFDLSDRCLLIKFFIEE